MKAPQTDQEALTLALALAIVAPDEERAQQATVIAEGFARELDELTVERCKEAALTLIDEWENE